MRCRLALIALSLTGFGTSCASAPTAPTTHHRCHESVLVHGEPRGPHLDHTIDRACMEVAAALGRRHIRFPTVLVRVYDPGQPSTFCSHAKSGTCFRPIGPDLFEVEIRRPSMAEARYLPPRSLLGSLAHEIKHVALSTLEPDTPIFAHHTRLLELRVCNPHACGVPRSSATRLD